MSIPALQLGSELIRRSTERGRPLTNLSLQKLAYFAHGWHLALIGQPLVNENFEAWRYGPVLPDLYHAFKGFSSNPIPPSHPLVACQDQIDPLSVKSQLIDRVLEVYGPYGSFGLVQLSHDQNGPWHEAYNDPLVSSIISNDSIRNYFMGLNANQ